jgi:hypothetical protein
MLLKRPEPIGSRPIVRSIQVYDPYPLHSIYCMNTPAHIVVNLLCLGRRDTATVFTPVIIGAVLPDAPMFVFYFVEKVVRGTPETVIWRQAYYQPHWQTLIDWFNSLPLMLVGILIASWLGSRMGVLLFSSMMLHVAGDLPLHNDDAHRHFLPLSNWRFISPVSYWDSNYYGDVVAIGEILLVIVGSALLFQRYRSRLAKISIASIGLLYLLHLLYVLVVWH